MYSFWGSHSLSWKFTGRSAVDGTVGRFRPGRNLGVFILEVGAGKNSLSWKKVDFVDFEEVHTGVVLCADHRKSLRFCLLSKIYIALVVRELSIITSIQR